MNDKQELLDHGYVHMVESWGSDERIIQAARMSTDNGFRGWGPKQCDCVPPGPATPLHEAADPNCKACKGTGLAAGDEKLLRYLWEHKHHTPFEMAGMTIEVQAPIFVFREWHRHRTQSYNELSARYTMLPDLYYVPSVERIMAGKQSTTNKQSSEASGFDRGQAQILRGIIQYAHHDARVIYENLIKQGLARELARVVVPVAQYSRMRASANLRNWLAFLTLRVAKGAQWEIRQYAIAVENIIKVEFPRTWELFNENHPG